MNGRWSVKSDPQEWNCFYSAFRYNKSFSLKSIDFLLSLLVRLSNSAKHTVWTKHTLIVTLKDRFTVFHLALTVFWCLRADDMPFLPTALSVNQSLSSGFSYPSNTDQHRNNMQRNTNGEFCTRKTHFKKKPLSLLIQHTEVSYWLKIHLWNIFLHGTQAVHFSSVTEVENTPQRDRLRYWKYWKKEWLQQPNTSSVSFYIIITLYLELQLMN